jgi:hypothetical protein
VTSRTKFGLEIRDRLPQLPERVFPLSRGINVLLEPSRKSAANDAAIDRSPARGGSGKVVDFAAYRRQTRRPEQARFCSLTLLCRNYMVGRDDWNRGIRALFRSYTFATEASWAADGSLRLHDFPLGELVLNANDVTDALADGLHFRTPDFEADIEVAEIRATLPAQRVPQSRSSR